MSSDSGEKNGGLLPRVYEDILHPAAKDVGEAVRRAVALTLSPVNGVLWTAEQALAWLEAKVSERFEETKTPKETVTTPSPALLGAVIVGVQCAAGEPTLSQLFANLLATSMDARTSPFAHPAYAEILRQMLPDEARLLRSFKPLPAVFPIVPSEPKAQPCGQPGAER